MASDSSQDGSGGSPTDADGVDRDGGGGKVDYATYAKTMDELKSIKKQLAEGRSELKKFQDAEREAKNKKEIEDKNFLGVIDELRAENETLKQENVGHHTDKTNFRKLNLALGLLQSKGISLEDKYFGMIPLDQIIVGEDGKPDKTSVAKVVADFTKEHPRLVLPRDKVLPNDRSSNGTRKLSIEEYKKLPRDEQAKALKEKRVDTSSFGF